MTNSTERLLKMKEIYVIFDMEVIHMDCQNIGNLILQLRKEKEMTQKELAGMMHISDRTISKWETGRGCPDVSLLQELSNILGVNIDKILLGDTLPNEKNGGNMKKIKFYVCPICGNALFATGDAEVSCCGRKIETLRPQIENNDHNLHIEEVENDLYITLRHDMSKEHYISFVAYVSYNCVSFVKLYPEQAAEVRIPHMHNGDIYWYCSKHGLMKKHG